MLFGGEDAEDEEEEGEEDDKEEPERADDDDFVDGGTLNSDVYASLLVSLLCL